MTWGQKYRLRFYDGRFNIKWEAKIEFQDYTGDIINLIGSSSPIIFDQPSVGDSKTRIIIGRSLLLSFVNEYFEQYTNDFSEAGGRRIQTTVLKDDVTYWVGFYVPDTLHEPYIAGTNIIEVEFNDGLGLLKETKFENNGVAYYGKKTLIDIIYFCLNKTGLELNLEESCLIYESYMDDNIEDSPLVQAYCDAENFIEDDEYIDCYEVLERILFHQVACISQKDGVWHMIPFENFKHSYSSRIYSYTFVGYSFDSIIERNNYTTITGGNVSLSDFNAFINRSQVRDIDRAYKSLKVSQDYGLDSNIIWNGDFKYWSGDFPLGFIKGSVSTYKKSNLNLLEDVLVWSTRTGFNMLDFLNWTYSNYLVNALHTFQFTLSYFFPVGSVITGTLNISIGNIGTSSTRYLNAAGSWVTFLQIIPYGIDPTTGYQLNSISIDIPTPPLNGYIVITIYAPIYSTANVGFAIKEIVLKFTGEPEIFKGGDNLEITINEENTKDIEFNMELGDIPSQGTLGNNTEMIYRKGLYRYSAGNYVKTASWVKSSQSGGLLELVSNELSLFYNKNRWKLTGEMIGHLDFGMRFIAPDGRIYIADDISNFDVKNARAELILLEIDRDLSVSEESGGWMEWTDSSGYVEWTDSEGYVEPTN